MTQRQTKKRPDKFNANDSETAWLEGTGPGCKTESRQLLVRKLHGASKRRTSSAVRADRLGGTPACRVRNVNKRDCTSFRMTAGFVSYRILTRDHNLNRFSKHTSLTKFRVGSRRNVSWVSAVRKCGSSLRAPRCRSWPSIVSACRIVLQVQARQDALLCAGNSWSAPAHDPLAPSDRSRLLNCMPSRQQLRHCCEAKPHAHTLP